MKKNNLKFPNRKISETFLEFSSPLLDAIGQAATKDQVEKEFIRIPNLKIDNWVN